tara:strand:- start:619 stop:1128 length:510 start_codon:yes stop_codon:yes gene_type:complete
MHTITEIKKYIYFYEKLDDVHINHIIKLIKEFSCPNINLPGLKTIKSDWDVSPDVERKYFNYFVNNAKDFQKLLMKKLDVNKIGVDNFWFQIYSKSDYHHWHTHPRTNFTNILYLKGGEEIQTELKGFKLKKFIYPGTILTFPSFIKHRSKINNSGDEKIVISFNTSVE